MRGRKPYPIVLRDPSSGRHPTATFSRKGRRIKRTSSLSRRASRPASGLVVGHLLVVRLLARVADGGLRLKGLLSLGLSGRLSVGLLLAGLLLVRLPRRLGVGLLFGGLLLARFAGAGLDLLRLLLVRLPCGLGVGLLLGERLLARLQRRGPVLHRLLFAGLLDRSDVVLLLDRRLMLRLPGGLGLQRLLLAGQPVGRQRRLTRQDAFLAGLLEGLGPDRILVVGPPRGLAVDLLLGEHPLRRSVRRAPAVDPHIMGLGENRRLSGCLPVALGLLLVVDLLGEARGLGAAGGRLRTGP